jgi:GT2 family glycosyltransferase
MPSMDPRPVLDIVIVNYNSGPYLRECLASVRAANQSSFSLGVVAVIDNASSDRSAELPLDPQLPLTVISNPVNRGFGAACNQGARAGRGDLILFLNPDVRLFVDTLEMTVRFITDPDNAPVAICGGQMVGEHGEHHLSCSRFPTMAMLVAKMTGLANVAPGLVPRQRMTREEASRGGFVDQVIGAYFMIRRDVFEDLDGFDERFFLYMEEVDLAFRGARHGYLSYFMPEVPVYHRQGGSSQQVAGRRLFYLLRSQIEYARKHWPAWQAPVLIGLIRAVELPVRAVLALVRGKYRDLRDVVEAASRFLDYVLTRETTG